MRQSLRRALGLVWLLLLAGCYQEASDRSAYQQSAGPWSVNGIELGMTQDDCRQRLGEPRSVRSVGQVVVWNWSQPAEVAVTLDPARGHVVVDVLGTSLIDAAGKTVMWSGMEEAAAKVILPDAKVSRSYSPTGGVISLGRKLTGTSYTVSSGGGTYTVEFRDGMLAHVRASR